MPMSPETSIEDLRPVVQGIQRAVRKLRQSGISDRALVLLIQHAAPRVPSRRGQQRMISREEIAAVLEGIEGLADFVFGE